MMPRSASPALSSFCCSAAIKPRKMLPAPKCTQMGCALVAAVMASWSNRGSLTPSFSHSAFWLTMEEAFICIVIDSFCLTAWWAVIMPSALISVYCAIFIRKMAEIA